MANFIWIFKQRPCVRRQKHAYLSCYVTMHIRTTCAAAVYVIHFTAWRNLTWRCNDIRINKWALCLMVCPRLQAGGSRRGNCVAWSAVFLSYVCVCDLLTTVGGWSDVVFETSARGACKYSSFKSRFRYSVTLPVCPLWIERSCCSCLGEVAP
jgi:hypothetical protein